MKNRIQQYYLGCPVWGNAAWAGEFFTPKAKPKDYLPQYSSVFNTVEGNHTFYGLPKANTVARWKEQASPDFRFCFKFPKTITHQYKLENVRQEVQAFFQLLAPLQEQIGCLFIQLPPSFNKQYLSVLDRFLATLPTSFSYAVEVRHLDFYDNGNTEANFVHILTKHQANWALFHSSTLHALPPDKAIIVTAQGKKPKMPDRFTVTGNHPFFRFVGHPTVDPNEKILQKIVVPIAEWIKAGKKPFVFMHTPSNDFYTPHLCKKFHELLQQQLGQSIDIGNMPAWPIQNMPKQTTLF